MDGLLSRVLYDLAIDLQRNGMVLGRSRVKLLPRSGTYSTSTSYQDGQALLTELDFVTRVRYLCQVGGYPILSNIELRTSSPSGYTISVYDATGSAKVTTVSPLDNARSTNIDAVVEKYAEYVRGRVAQYANDCQISLAARTSLYVDPCYVDAGYVSP